MSTRRHSLLAILALLAALTAHGAARAETGYYVGSINDLVITEGNLGETEAQPWRMLRGMSVVADRGSLSAPGEIFLARAENVAYLTPRFPRDADQDLEDARYTGVVVAIRAESGRDVTGTIRLQSDAPEVVKFRVPGDRIQPAARRDFMLVQRQFYAGLLGQDLPGAAWFRHRMNELERELDLEVTETNRTRRFFGRRGTDLTDTYALMSGGRALSENLQLDRMLPDSERAKATVSLSSLQGITVQEFDWKSLVEGKSPKLDPLARWIPHDQHVLFLDSFQNAVALADQATEQGTPLLRLAEPRGENARTRERYERQLGLSLGSAARLLGPQLIKSLALTGGDPYFRTGTDVAVVFEAGDPATLAQFLATQITVSAKQHPQATPVDGNVAGVAYQGMISPDRSVSSYWATIGEAVVVTNSVVQLERIATAYQDPLQSLVSLDEYKFFRDRYPRGDSDETGLLILTDATIRRWCGPKWRIASSRRTRAAAIMAELQATYLQQLVQNEMPQGPVESPYVMPDDTQFVFKSDGIGSPNYGDIFFQRPISEMDFAKVTPEEARLYRRWRDGYQREWSRFFDPIAVRFTAKPERLAADVTVMPLIAGSDYRQFINLSQGEQLEATDGDPHPEAILHWAMALNSDSPFLRQNVNLVRAFAPQIRIDPLSWIGDAVAFYVDDHPVWSKTSELSESEMEDFFQENINQIPVAFHVEVKSGLKLTAFLAGVRAFIEQTAPGMTVWETLEHNGEPYVRIVPSERARGDLGGDLDRMALHYSASGDGLLFTLNEDVMRRALDRRVAARKAKKEGKEVEVAQTDWAGQNLALKVDRRFLGAMGPLFAAGYRRQMQATSWNNLPILNEWKRKFPELDPVAMHESIWHRELVCPGGGKYRWNEDWQTMESTVYGHPAQPNDGPPLPPTLMQMQSGNFGVLFEENGLRARMELKRATE